MQQQHDIAPHMETLTRALGEKAQQIDAAELEAEFRKYLEYGVPVPEAIRTILRHHGAEAPPELASSGPAGNSGERIALSDLPASAPAVNVRVRLVTLNTKTVNARGEEKQILWGLVGDESGTCAYTSWRPLEGVEKGDVIEVRGAYTKTWRDEVQLNFGDRCNIEKLERDALPPVVTQLTDRTVAELQDGVRDFRVKGRILDVSPRTVNVKGEEKTIYGGTLADTTGKIEFTAWEDVGLKTDTVVTIEGGYVRSYQGTPQLNFDGSATIKAAEDDLPDAEELDDVPVMPVGELVAQGGASDVKLVGTLLEVRPGSGLIFRDPATKRALQPGQKPEGGGEGEPDLRIKGVLDDGTGAVQFVVGRDITERLLGMDLEQCQEEARQAYRHEVIQDRLAEKLTGLVFRIRGFARSDEYGTMVIARSMDEDPIDVAAAAKEILDSLPASPIAAGEGSDAPPSPSAPEAESTSEPDEEAAA